MAGQKTGVDKVYRSLPIKRYAIGGGLDLVHCPGLDKTLVLLHSDSDLLAFCSEFRTAFAHAERASATLGGSVEQYLSRINDLLTMHLLLDPRGSINRLRAINDKAGALISWLAFPTSGCLDRVLAALRSYVGNRHVALRTVLPRILIADSSDSPAVAENSKQTVVEQCSHFQGDLFYVGKAECCLFIEALARKGIPAEVLRFALLGTGRFHERYGTARNAILLQTVGEMLLSADDDTVCRIATPDRSGHNRPLHLAGDGASPETWFFPTRSDVLGFVQEHPGVDILGQHERLLGRSVAGAILLWGDSDGVSIETSCSHLFGAALSGSGRVLATTNGIYGDSGAFSSSALALCQDDAIRTRIFQSQAAYQSATRSREIVRQWRSPSISHIDQFTTTVCGLDNRELLPPFYPECRGEDGLYAVCLARCVPDGFSGHLDFSTLHDPLEPRCYTPLRASAFPLSVLVQLLILSCPGSAVPRATAVRLELMGKWLCELCRHRADFEEVMITALRQTISRQIRTYEHVLTIHKHPPQFWVAEMGARLKDLQETIRTAEVIVPFELGNTIMAPEAGDFIRDCARRFGELLVWWPSIVETAGRLRRDCGVSLARRL